MIVSQGKRARTIEELIPSELAGRLDRLDVVSRKVFAGKMQGERRSKRRGQSVEFADYRNYVPGDDLRRIDWNVFARLDKFFIRIFQEEEDLALHIVVDASASMDAGGEANKLLFAQRLAMALGYIGLVNNNRVSVAVIDNRTLRRLEPVRGRPNVQRLGRFVLEAVLPREEGDGAIQADFTGALKALAMTRTGKGVMVVLSDIFIPGGYEEGLRYLAGGGGFDTYCLQVLSPGEIDPSAEAAAGGGGLIGDLRLTDAETGRSAEVTITADLIGRYKASLEKYNGALSEFCGKRGIAYSLVRSDTDVASLVLDVLRRRGLLK